MTRDAAEKFIERWEHASGTEIANYQLFVLDLCKLLDVPAPEPANEDTRDNAYVFQRGVKFAHGDGSETHGLIDCYKRGAFVLEAKKLRQGAATKGFSDALLRARKQGESYARALPAAEGRPPFVVVVDVGHVIELYAEFSRSGATYTPFPDARSHRITLRDLADETVRAQLRKVWLEPLELDPTRASAKVTRAVAEQLAEVAKSLEKKDHAPEHVAAFLTRCLFSMFAEDVELLPKRAFLDLLEKHREKPAKLREMLRILWTDMDRGGFSAAIADDVKQFNGKVFKNLEGDSYALPLDRAQIDMLITAAQANWREVEPAIFGTLLERALDPRERHALGAHYTPRAYVERLVLPTIVEPLRADWEDAQAAAVVLANEAASLSGAAREAKLDEARAEVLRFHHELCAIRVLDPACGSGNFLYVTLEHLKRLEGEVLVQLEAFGAGRKGAQHKLGYTGETVTVEQLRGIELNERAASIAELVLWIGFLQWQIRTHGKERVSVPVIRDFANIECRDAVLAYDRDELALDPKTDRALTRWDGVTFKKHPVTGENVPDEKAQKPEFRYVNPRKAEWPKADFIVGNPPFIGNKRMRDALGDGYVETLREAWPDVPESADLVMYWWHHAATLVREGAARQFGLITTNSLTMFFNRRIVEQHLNAKEPLHLAFAIPDHPWVDSTDGAAVRIAMTVTALGKGTGRLLTVTAEHETATGEVLVDVSARNGVLHPDLRIGADLGSAAHLAANVGVSFMGVILVGEGFVMQPGDPLLKLEPSVVRRYMNGRDLTQTPRECFVLDLFGYSLDEVRRKFPHAYQRVLNRVKPERENVKRPSHRRDWWLFGEKRPAMRQALAGLPKYIGTTETSKHRTFSFIESAVLPDQKIRVVALAGAEFLGILSSTVHTDWSHAAGGRLGVGNDPVYNNTTCFEPFPFPDDDTGLTAKLRARIRELGEELDAHRKGRQAAHDELTLTGMYNVLEKLRANEPLSAKDKRIHEQGLVSVLRTLHDELDLAVLAAYGWSDLGAVPWADETARAAWTEKLLERLVALNHKRAAEEAAFERGEPGGKIRWLRPEFQDPARRAAAPKQRQTALVLDEALETKKPLKGKRGAKGGPAVAVAKAVKQAWPATLPEQVRVVAQILSSTNAWLDVDALAAHFTGRGAWKERLPQILETLEALGRARQSPRGWRSS